MNKLHTRAAQTVLSAYFEFDFDDTMVDTSGATKDFGKTNTAATSFAVINLPPNSVVVGGALARSQAFDAATYNVTVGDATTANRYLTSTDVKGAGITALVPTGYVNEPGAPIVLGVTPADACTTGKAMLRVDYVVLGRANEVT